MPWVLKVLFSPPVVGKPCASRAQFRDPRLYMQGCLIAFCTHTIANVYYTFRARDDCKLLHRFMRRFRTCVFLAIGNPYMREASPPVPLAKWSPGWPPRDYPFHTIGRKGRAWDLGLGSYMSRIPLHTPWVGSAIRCLASPAPLWFEAFGLEGFSCPPVVGGFGLQRPAFWSVQIDKISAWSLVGSRALFGKHFDPNQQNQAYKLIAQSLLGRHPRALRLVSAPG